MLCGAVIVGSNGCAARAAVELAARDDETAEAAPARGDDAAAWAVERPAIAAILVLVELSLEDVASALERGELGASAFQHDVELAKSASCWSLTGHAPPIHSTTSTRAPSWPGRA